MTTHERMRTFKYTGWSKQKHGVVDSERVGQPLLLGIGLFIGEKTGLNT